MPRKPILKNRLKPRRNNKPGDFNRVKRRKFLRHLRKNGNVGRACEYIGFSRQAITRARRTDDEFAIQYDEAMEAFIDDAEQELYRRGVHGVDKPLFYQGQISLKEDGKPVTIKEYSDYALVTLIKGRRKSIYSDRQEIVGKDGGPLEFQQTRDELAEKLAQAVNGGTNEVPQKSNGRRI